MSKRAIDNGWAERRAELPKDPPKAWTRLRWRAAPFAVTAFGLVVSVTLPARPASGRLDEVTGSEHCSAWDVTYSVTAILKITETPLGAGDGVHAVGPGTLVLRLDEHARATLIAFELREYFAISPKAVLWNATVVMDATMRATPDASGAAGGGVLANDVLRWAGPIQGYRSDGALTCDGSLCGKFGAPPAGRTELHWPPTPVRFQPLQFAQGGATFEMPYALVSYSESPRQRTYMALVGREAHRTCAPPPPQ